MLPRLLFEPQVKHALLGSPPCAPAPGHPVTALVPTELGHLPLHWPPGLTSASHTEASSIASGRVGGGRNSCRLQGPTLALLADGALLFAGYFQFGTLEARNVTVSPGLWCCDEMPAPAKSTGRPIQAWGLTERLISPSTSWLRGIVSGGWCSVRPHAACAPPAEGAANVLCFRDKGPVRQWRAGWIQDKSSCHTVTALCFT